MSQQEMGYGQVNREEPGLAYGRYEGDAGFGGSAPSNMFAGKLSVQASGRLPTTGQRFALAIVTLVIFMILVFGLVGIAWAAQAPSWAIAPILFILLLFSAVGIIINIVFNRKG